MVDRGESQDTSPEVAQTELEQEQSTPESLDVGVHDDAHHIAEEQSQQEPNPIEELKLERPAELELTPEDDLGEFSFSTGIEEGLGTSLREHEKGGFGATERIRNVITSSPALGQTQTRTERVLDLKGQLVAAELMMSHIVDGRDKHTNENALASIETMIPAPKKGTIALPDGTQKEVVASPLPSITDTLAETVQAQVALHEVSKLALHAVEREGGIEIAGKARSLARHTTEDPAIQNMLSRTGQLAAGFFAQAEAGNTPGITNLRYTGNAEVHGTLTNEQAQSAAGSNHLSHHRTRGSYRDAGGPSIEAYSADRQQIEAQREQLQRFGIAA